MRYFYTAFHLNLAFSSLPQKDHLWIIEHCYWPLIHISQKYDISLGIELSGYTLELIHKYDNEFIQTIKSLVKKNRIEILGSGYSQAIYPLIPFQSNLYNLIIANELYDKYLGTVPKIAYVNEQVYSNGMISLFSKAGYTSIIIDRLNSPLQQSALSENNSIYHSLYSPRNIENADADTLTVLWNDSIAFQKFQRYTQGTITFEEYLQYLFITENKHTFSVFPLYGSDLEIFDYRPGNMSRFFTSSFEMQKIETLFSTLSKKENVSLITPSKVLELFAPLKNLPKIELGSSSEPILCKKQIKYNPTRWAVTGRDDSIINGECYQLYQLMNDIENHTKKKLPSKDWKALAYLWSSDFRTNCTDEKFLSYSHDLGVFSGYIHDLHQRTFKANKKNTLYIYTQHGLSFIPFCFHFRFPKGKFKNFKFLFGKKHISSQIESANFYSDNTLKEVKGRASFFKTRKTTAQLSLSPSKISLITPQYEKYETAKIEFSTSAVSLQLNPLKGGTIEKAVFNDISSKPLFGTIPHGYYESPKWSPDFFSGHFLGTDREDTKLTDLQKAVVYIPKDKNHFPVALPVIVEVDSKIGLVRKTYYLYQDIPCFDLVYHFHFNHFDPVSFRLGMLTIFPLSFDLDSLFYACHNGGNNIEMFSIKDSPNFYHGEAVNRGISAQTCVGNTQNRFIVGDSEKEIHVQQLSLSPKVFPMIQFEKVPPAYFFRTEFSLTELDETRLKIWNGDVSIGFRYSAMKAENRSERYTLHSTHYHTHSPFDAAKER